MKRRSFLAALCTLLGVRLSIAYGQKHPPLVGWIAFGDERAVEGFIVAFREGIQAVNLKTAKTLGLAIPQQSLLRADRVIE